MNIIGKTPDGRSVVSGADIFRLKDESGFPFSLSFSQCEQNKAMIDWVGLVEAARKAGWWDYQTVEAIEEAFVDSGAWPAERREIVRSLKMYVGAVPHPALA